MFLAQKKLIGLKLDAPAYVEGGMSLANSDLFFRADNLKYTPAIAEYARKYATGDLAKYASVMGKRDLTIAFSLDLAWGGAVATAPEWDSLLQSCGFTKTAYTTTGIGWALGSINVARPLTLWIVEMNEASTAQMLIKGAGMCGSVKFSMAKVGDPIKMDFEFKGVFGGIVDATGSSLLSHGTFVASSPDAVLASTVTAMGYALDMEKIEINIGNKVELITDPARAAGIRGGIIVSREPKLTADPYLDSIANKDFLTKWTGNTTGAFSMTVGTHLTLSAPAQQIIKAYDGGARNELTTNALDFNLTRTSDSVDAEFEILQGSKT